MKHVITFLATLAAAGSIHAQETQNEKVVLQAEAAAADTNAKVDATNGANSDAGATDMAEANPEEAMIRKAIDSYVEAFNGGDAGELAKHWAPEGELVTPGGVRLQGHEALQASFAAFFAESAGAQLELLDTQIEFLSPHVAIETGMARVFVPEDLPSESRYRTVHVKSAAGWKIDSSSEEEVPSPPPSHYEQLQDLEWMIGTWVDQEGEASIETRCRWTTNNNFIVRSFKVFAQDRVDFEGTQVIGWDPSAESIRSWMFDSDGGFGVGRWSNDGARWTVQSLSVLPDGRRGSATNVYELIDSETVEFRSIGRQVDGVLMPSIPPVRIVRVQ